MHPLKSILKQSFFFAILTATTCTTQKHNFPIPPNPMGQKKNSKPSITISSTGTNAVVCIGSNNSIHMGTTGQEAQANTGINDLGHSKLGNQNTITPQGPSIPITPTDPNDRALVESSNTTYRPDRSTQQQLKATNKIPKDQHKTTAENNKKIEVEESKGSRNGTEQSREKELEKLKKIPDPPNQTTNNDKVSELEDLKENVVNLLSALGKLKGSTISGRKHFKTRFIYDDSIKLKKNLKNLLKELKNLDPDLCLEEKFKCIRQKIENNYIDINKLKKGIKTLTKNDKKDRQWRN